MKNTTLIYLEQDGKYLMLHRIKKQNDVNEGKWVGIGGKFLDEESPQECIARETLEETGLYLLASKLCGIVTFVSDQWESEIMFVFKSSSFEGELKSDCDEGFLSWVDKTEIFSLPMWEGDKVFLRKFCDDSPFFSIKLVYQGEKLINVIEY